jgi:hypothetical protein
VDEGPEARVLAEAHARLELAEASGPLAAAIPASRRRMPGFCPYCAGTGNEPAPGFEETGEFEKCLRCDGTGDLDAARLLRAYECGYRDALGSCGPLFREALRVLALADFTTAGPLGPFGGIVELRKRIGAA